MLDESASKNLMYGTGIANTQVKAKARTATGGGERGVINEVIHFLESRAIAVQAQEAGELESAGNAGNGIRGRYLYRVGA